MNRNLKIYFSCFFVLMLYFQTIGQVPISIKNRRQLFLDRYIIEELNDVEMRLHHPVNEGPVLHFDKPWEGQFSNYCTIIDNGDKFSAYYRGSRIVGKDGNDTEVTCYAESKDGTNWVKPNLGIFEFNGSKDNNIVLANAAPSTHNFSPFKDKNPNVDKAYLFKALGGVHESGLMAYGSHDGIHWQIIHEMAVIYSDEFAFDSQNVVFWSESENMYVCYFRSWTKNRFRSVSRTTSKDFIHWTEPEKMEFGDTPYEHLYTQQTSPYYRAPQIYVAIGARFMPNRQVLTDKQAERLNVNSKYFKDCSDAIIMTSRGSNEYDRTFMKSYIKPGIGLQNWVSRSNYPALNIVQTGDTEMSVYVNENYAQPTAHLKRYSMRLDGFASLEADYDGGMLLTKPFTFEGRELEINYATSAAGSLKIALLDEDGNEIPSFGMEDCQEIIGNEIQRIVNWNGNQDVSALEGETIRLKVMMKDTYFYSFKFNK